MTIFKTYWKIVKKNIGIIILYTVMLLVFGTMNLKANKNSFEFISSKPDIIIVNNSSGIITDNLISYLKTNANVKNITDENDIDDAVFFRDANYVIYIPKTSQYFTNSLAIIPLQLFGYYVSVGRGLDVDKPRNLAKSVTVE